MSDEELIGRYIEPNPHKPTLAEAWLKGSALPVWALIGSLPGVDHDPDRLAEEFGVPIEAVRAAVAFYARHRCLIDARLTENATAAGIIVTRQEWSVERAMTKLERLLESGASFPNALYQWHGALGWLRRV